MAALRDSRFYMWRTVFALAHADGQVTTEEARFMKIYLSRLSLSSEQHEILKGDIEQRQDVASMFAKITLEKDIEDFFIFARLIVWCDGDFSAQEEQIMEMLRQRRDTPLGTERLLSKLQETGREKAGWLTKVHASVSGLKDIFDLFPDDGEKASAKISGKGVSDSRFYMWRAVFGMAHADDVVTAEEKKYLRNILATEPFNQEQRLILERDIDVAQDIAAMFVKIEDQSDRSQFFYHARMLVWSDGDFGEQEQKIIMRLKGTHVRTVDFDQIIQDLDLTLDDDQKVKLAKDRHRVIDHHHAEGFFHGLIRRITGRT